MTNAIETARKNAETIARREAAHPGTWTAELRAALGKLAQAEHADFPQYEGHWAGPEWVIVKVTRRVKTKMGVAFEKGELALARRTPVEPDSANLSPAARAELNKPSWTVYSVKNRCDTVVSVRTCKAV